MVEVREAGGPLDRLVTRGPPPTTRTLRANRKRLVSFDPPQHTLPHPPSSSTNCPSSDLPDIRMSSPPPGSSTPTSSAESANNERKKKRVEFSPYNQYHPPLPTDQKYPPTLRRSLSAQNAPPAKSILKPYQSVMNAATTEDLSDLPDFGRPAYTHASFGEMLESVVKALASSERSKKSDTYASFANTMKAYDVIPNQQALIDKMGLLCSFIKRDLSIKVEENGAQDLMLIKQALKVLSILVWLPFLKDSIDEDDATFFLQFAITTVEQSTSKGLINSCLHLLSIQNFNAKVLNNDKAGKIITAVDLKNKQANASSVTSIIERISIYMKLLHQARPVMIARVADWIDHLFESMLSTVREIRVRAIALASEVSKTIGMEKNVSRAVYHLLGSNSSGNTNGKPNPTGPANTKSQNMFATVKEKLENLLASENKDDAVHAPQIWGHVVALLRGLLIPLDRWEHFSPWLTIISRCFNSSEIVLKVQAHAAWAKVIYVSNINGDMTDKRFDLIVKPIVGYLDRSKVSKNSRAARDAAIKNINTLLYYGFRPNCTAKQNIVVWNKFVTNLLEKYVLSNKFGASSGTATLGWLLDPTPPTSKWNEFRALDAAHIKSEELPRLDPKWVRSNSALVLKSLETAFQSAYWMAEDAGSAPETWRKFNTCIAAAGSKEIKASAELMETVANIFNLLQRTWIQVPPMLVNSAAGLSSFVSKFTALITIALEVLKPLCFTESKLSHDGHSHFAAVMTTPSGRSSSGSPALVMQSPALHLFALLIKPPKELTVDDAYMNCIETFLWTCVESRDSRRKRLGLLTEAMSLLPTKNVDSIHLAAWQIVSELANRSMPLPVKEKALSSPSPAGHDFREAVRILEWGCQYGESSIYPEWDTLFVKLRETVQREFGDAEVCSAITQPLAEILRQQKVSERLLLLQFATLLLHNTTYPKIRANQDSIHRNLYGMPSRKLLTVVDPFESLYRMMNVFLPECFNILRDTQASEHEDALNFINSVILFIGKIPMASVVKALRQLHEGLSCSIDNDSSNEVATAKALELWKATLEALQRVKETDSAMLQQISPLLTTGLNSKRRAIVSATLTYWNETFGLQQSLEYPSPVRHSLGRLRNVADILLPTFPDLEDDEVTATPPRFSESQTEDDGWSEQSRPSIFKIKTPRLQVSEEHPLAKSSRDPTPTKSANRTATARKLRHMDSQIVFEPIASDDVDEEMESQMLTERQKEVKERQANETLFKDVGGNATPAKASKTTTVTPESLTPQAKLVLRVASPEVPSSVEAIPKSQKAGGRTKQASGGSQDIRNFLRPTKVDEEVEVPSSPLARASARKSQTPVAEKRNEIPSSPPDSPKAGPIYSDDPDDPFVDNAPTPRAVSQGASERSRDPPPKLIIQQEDQTTNEDGADITAPDELLLSHPEIAELPEEEETDRDDDPPGDLMDIVEDSDELLSPTDDPEVSRQLMSELSMSQSFTEEPTSPVSPVSTVVSPVDERAPRRPGRPRRGSTTTRKRKRDVRVVEPFSDNAPELSDDDALDCIVVSTAPDRDTTQFETAPSGPGLEPPGDRSPPKKKLKSPSPPEIPTETAAHPIIPSLRKTRSWLGFRTTTTAAPVSPSSTLSTSHAGMLKEGSDPSATGTVNTPKSMAPENKTLTKLDAKQRLSLPSIFRTRKTGTASSAEATNPEASNQTVAPEAEERQENSPLPAPRSSSFSVTIPVKRKLPEQPQPKVDTGTEKSKATEEDETDDENESATGEMSKAEMVAKLTTSLNEFRLVLDRADDNMEVLNVAEDMMWRMMSKVRNQKANISRRPAAS